MPTRSRVTSKPSRHAHTDRGSRKSVPSQSGLSVSTMNVQDPGQSRFSYTPSRPLTHSSQDQQTTQWIAGKDETSYNPSGCVRSLLDISSAEPCFLTRETNSVSEDTWANVTTLDNLHLDPCPQFVGNYPYRLSESSGSSHNGSQPMLDQVAFDNSISLPNEVFLGSGSLAMGMVDHSFTNDFSSGSLSYDSSVYISPPHSPRTEGQAWSGSTRDPQLYGEDNIRGDSNVVYSQLGAYANQQTLPPSPPLSDAENYPLHPSSGYQVLHGNSRYESGTSRYRNDQILPCDLGASSISTSTRSSVPTSHISTQPHRPTPRVLKPASEKPRGYDLEMKPAFSHVHAKPKEKPEAAQPRNHHLYKALPGKDGLFKCPFARDTNCAHMPTKQKCGYDKYLDSHLKPYQCKHKDCQDLRFSSNACLFRHEREAHGMHFYGKNPHLCHFVGCERATEGFPRRWNLYDHMRRVHKYTVLDSRDEYSDCEVPSKRKGSGAPGSCQMKRTSSSQAKARIASATYSRDDDDINDWGYPVSHGSNQGMEYGQTYDLVNPQTLNLAGEFSANLEQFPCGDSAPRMSYGYSHAR